MAMGIVSDSDFNSELEKLNPSKNESINEPVKIPTLIKDIERGRGSNPGVPDGLRRIIGDESITNGRDAALALANSFGLSASSVSAYAKGATSTATYNDRPNETTITDAKQRVSKKARSKLMLALNHLTAEKIGTEKARDISAIAKDMSSVIRNMEPPSTSLVSEGGPKFVVYSPTFKHEEHYQTLVVKE